MSSNESWAQIILNKPKWAQMTQNEVNIFQSCLSVKDMTYVTIFEAALKMVKIITANHYYDPFSSIS